MRIIVSSALPDEIKASLRSVGDVFCLMPDGTVAPPVSTHPDMLVSVIGRKAFLPKIYADNSPALCSFLCKAGLEPVLCYGKRGQQYPLDVGLNCAVGDGFIITRVKSTDEAILDFVRDSGYEIIGVNQGYAGCSTIICGDSVITSDSGIYSAVTASGRDCLPVRNDGILLPGYDAGFIGGCGGYHSGVLYFFGNIDSLPCGKPIRDFAERKKIEVRCLSDGALTDYGGIKFV